MTLVRAGASELTDGGFVAGLLAILPNQSTAGVADYSAAKSALSAWLGVLRREERRRFNGARRTSSAIPMTPPRDKGARATRHTNHDQVQQPEGHDHDHPRDRYPVAAQADPASAYRHGTRLAGTVDQDDNLGLARRGVRLGTVGEAPSSARCFRGRLNVETARRASLGGANTDTGKGARGCPRRRLSVKLRGG